MAKHDVNTEFDRLTSSLEISQSDEAIQDELRMYYFEDEEFRRAVLDRITELTGIQTGKVLFDGEA